MRVAKRHTRSLVRACGVAVLVCLASATTFGQSRIPDPALLRGGSQASEDAAVSRLREIQQELIKAWLGQDRLTIERLLAPDWTVTGPTGVASSREKVLADAFERRIHRLLSGTVSDVSVRLMGKDAAVVTGHTRATGTYDGVPYDADIRFTDVFERHSGDWRAVRSHASSMIRQ